MKVKGIQLEFISKISPDGSKVSPVDKKQIELAETSEFTLNSLSLTNETYIASGMSSYVVKLKSKPVTPHQFITSDGPVILHEDVAQYINNLNEQIEQLNAEKIKRIREL